MIDKWRISGLALMAATAMPLAAEAQEVLRVGKPVWESVAFAVLEVGSEIGAFEERGITIEAEVFGGQGALTQALTGGVVDIALMSGSAMALVPNDAPFSAVAEYASQPLNMVVIVPPDSEINGVEDLEGKSLAVTSTTALTASLARLLADEQGWGVDGIETVGLGATEAQWAGVIAGNVDGIVAGIEFAHTLVSKDEGRIGVVIGEHVPHFVTHGIFASNELIERDPELVRGFVAGFLDAIVYTQEHPAEAAAIMAPIIQQSEEDTLALLEQQVDMFRPDGRFLQEDVDVMVDLFMEQGLFPERPDNATLYTEEFLPE